MRQFTMNIDDGLLHAAKARALQTGRSVSEIVRDLLSRELGWSGAKAETPVDDETALPVLMTYAEGRISRRRAMEAIGLQPDQYSALVVTMERLSLPWPKVDRAQVEREADIVARAIAEACDED